MWIALISVGVTLVLAMLGAVWHMSAMATRLTEAARRFEEDSLRWQKKMDMLERIPIIEVKLEQLDEMVTKTSSMIPRIVSRVDLLEAEQRFRSKELKKPEGLK